MSKCLIIVLLFCTAKLYSQTIYIDPLKLSWSNYIGNVNYDSIYTALTYSGMKLGIIAKNGKVTFKVYPTFTENLSWVDYQKLSKEKEGPDYILNHEKLHYYISIINARKLKLFVTQHPPKNNKELNNLKEYFDKKNQSDQDVYDAATKHAFLRDKQEEWSKKIMAEYEATKNIKLDIPK